MKDSYPIEEIYIRQLAQYIDKPYKEGLRPIDVILNPQWYPEEYQEFINSDLSIPIDVMPIEQQYILLNGLNQLVKSWITCQHKVKVRKIHK